LKLTDLVTTLGLCDTSLFIYNVRMLMLTEGNRRRVCIDVISVNYTAH